MDKFFSLHFPCSAHGRTAFSPLFWNPLFKIYFTTQITQIILKGMQKIDGWFPQKGSKVGITCSSTTDELIFFSKFEFIFNWISIQLMWMSTRWNAILGITKEFNNVDINQMRLSWKGYDMYLHRVGLICMVCFPSWLTLRKGKWKKNSISMALNCLIQYNLWLVWGKIRHSLHKNSFI